MYTVNVSCNTSCSGSAMYCYTTIKMTTSLTKSTGKVIIIVCLCCVYVETLLIYMRRRLNNPDVLKDIISKTFM